ncbi:hypothetical protein LTR95_011694 [Oleoguttula sp. CCFEE 5521]
MATAIPKNSVWTAMSYPPPRGPCNHKASLLSASCSCLRFMLHPIKAASSFECDGCAHHASFHSLENLAEDAVVKKWAAAEREAKGHQQTTAGAGGSKKRKLLVERSDAAAGGGLVELEEVVGVDRRKTPGATRKKLGRFAALED